MSRVHGGSRGVHSRRGREERREGMRRTLLFPTTVDTETGQERGVASNQTSRA